MIKAIIGLTLTLVCLLLLIASINSTITVLELQPESHGITVAKFYAIILLAIINSALFCGMLINMYGIYIAYNSNKGKRSINKMFKSIIEDLKKEDTARPSNYDFRRNPLGHEGNNKRSIFDDLVKFDKVEKNGNVNAGSKRRLPDDDTFGKPINGVLGKEDDKREGKEL